jgi:asparagine synthase (glutamine-hydrolysing)
MKDLRASPSGGSGQRVGEMHGSQRSGVSLATACVIATGLIDSMCGLFAALARGRPLVASYAGSMALLRHRGPDGEGVEIIGVSNGCGGELPNAAWLGHRRLSIIDPSERGRQPMPSSCGRFWLTFNGEIYNYIELRTECRRLGYSFRTESDSEVLLAAWSLWGPEALRRFIGMFAFVLVDVQEARAWLARDHFGIKPLHYAVSVDSVLVSSEIPALLATGQVPFNVDEVQAFEYLRFGSSTEEERTIIGDIHRLPSGSYTSLDLRTGKLDVPTRFWRPESKRRSISFAEAVKECRQRFIDNVRLHLRSDVPVGAALSGGLDSSAIVSAVKTIEPDLRLNTFSFISEDPRQSEEHWVDIVNDAVNAIPHKIRPSPTDLAEDLSTMVRRQGEPFGSASIYAQFRVFKAARAAGVPVTLDGQGADELLGGYWPFVGTLGASLIRRGRVAAAIRLVQGQSIPRNSRAMVAANVLQSSLPASLQRALRAVLGRGVTPDYLDRDWVAAHAPRWKAAAHSAIGGHDNLNDHLLDATSRSSLPNLLRLADRSSMAFSVESRVPFLTSDFAEFLFSLPDEYLISSKGTRKHVFVEAMRGIVPEPIRTRTDKIGFFADDAVWLRANWTNLAPAFEEVGELPMIDKKRLQSFLKRFRNGHAEGAQLVWRLMVYALWRREMQILIP